MEKGIIFDFNGTMVFDGHLHEKAWVELIHKYNDTVSAEEIIDYIHGRTNVMVLRHFIKDLNDEEVERLSIEKEEEYQRLVRLEELWYVDGTEELLDHLKTMEVPFTIATASPKINVDFYFEYFQLGRWFHPDKIIYDDGTFPGKPDPTIYQMAAASLGLDPKDCIVIEDALAGIESANRAGVGQVFVMTHAEGQRTFYDQSGLEFEGILTDFNHFLHILN